MKGIESEMETEYKFKKYLDGKVSGSQLLIRHGQ